MIHYTLRAKNAGKEWGDMMNDDVVQVFRLEKVLKIVDLQHTARSLVDDLNASFPHDIFNVDYVQLEALRQKIGDIGERYVYECEKNRLAGSEYAERVDPTPAQNPQNGYDILSYTMNGEPIYIEVKSTIGDLNAPFYLTKNERETANHIRKQGGIYQIHRVYNIGGKIDVHIFDNDSMFEYAETLYQVNLKKQDTNKL